MPHLNAKPSTTRLYLPSTADLPEADRAWVDIRSKVYLSDSVAIDNIESTLEAGMTVLSRLMVAWNYTDVNTGDPVPVTIESIKQMEKQDFLFLDKWVSELLDSQQEGLSKDEKKPSSATSIAVSTDEAPPSNPQPTT